MALVTIALGRLGALSSQSAVPAQLQLVNVIITLGATTDYVAGTGITLPAPSTLVGFGGSISGASGATQALGFLPSGIRDSGGTQRPYLICMAGTNIRLFKNAAGVTTEIDPTGADIAAGDVITGLLLTDQVG